MKNKFCRRLEPETSQQTALIFKDRYFYVPEVPTERLCSLTFAATGVSTAVRTITTFVVDETWLKSLSLGAYLSTLTCSTTKWFLVFRYISVV